MKECSNCGKELAQPLDEYGPVQAPLCWDCFSDPEKARDGVRESGNGQAKRDSSHRQFSI